MEKGRGSDELKAAGGWGGVGRAKEKADDESS